jgi:AraC family transcriptional regulator, regulatory protein of adaptative response / DNA-3-methyladenine glycosylase II
MMPSKANRYQAIAKDATQPRGSKTGSSGHTTNTLCSEVLATIADGALNHQGVSGLADELHISERHLRRIVRARTGSSPLQLNTAKRLGTAKQLITETNLPIIDIAFMADFSSLRQFNAVFKLAFKTSPRAMRKTVLRTPQKRSHRFVALPLSHLVDMPVSAPFIRRAST